MKPKLSVIIPIYNTEKYLDKCIRSILNQSYKDYEIILVDDSSTDASGEICDSYAGKYDFIKVIHKEHGGPTQTRKAGFLTACGEYISYIDSDDSIASEMYEYMMEKIEKYNADIGICDIMIETENSSFPMCGGIFGGFYDKEKLKKEIYPYMLFSVAENRPLIAPSLCNKIIRRSLLKKIILGADESIYYGEDAVCSYPCLLDAQTVYFTKDKYFYRYKNTKYSLSRKYDRRLMGKLPLLISIFDAEFEKRNFDGEIQLNCYAASQLMFGIRNELLFNRTKSLTKKVKELKSYIHHPRFKEVFDTARRVNIDKKLKAKLHLAEKGHLYILFLMFFFKEKILLLREKRSEYKS